MENQMIKEYALSAWDLLTPEEIAEQLDGVRLQYPRVKIPAGGGLMFEIPNPEDPDNPECVKELTGVIVDHFLSNAYWADADAMGEAPACSAPDAKTGCGDPGGDCAACPLNQFGSGEGGNGKACKNMRRIYLLRPNTLIPCVLSLPPTSLRAFDTYLGAGLIASGIHPSSVVTRVRLKKAKSKDGIEHSVAAFSVAERFDAETARTLKAEMARLKEQIRSTERQPYPADAGNAAETPGMPF